MKTSIYSSLVIMGLLSMGCEKFLDEQPRSAIGSDGFFQTQADALAGVNAVYSALSGHYNGNAWYFGDVSTEVANRGELTGGLDVMDYTAADPVFRDFWTSMYRGINYANNVIKWVPAMEINEQLRDRYVGEAKFLRALFYFELARGFGGIPLITEPTENTTNNSIPRADLADVYALIVSDLQAASAALPPSYSGSERGRATSGAALGLLAKVYLTQGNWQEARETAKAVMESETYSLFANFADVFKPANENGKEHLFSVQYTSGNSRGGGSSLTSAFASRNPNILLNGAIAGTAVATERAFYDAVPDHYRKRISMVAEFPSENYPEITVSGPAQAGPAPMKYWDPTFGMNIGGDANWIVLRYADVLLVFAEAENELSGPTDAAYEAVNAVRKRARDENANGMDEAGELAELPNLEGLSKEGFREAVWAERRMELCFEGHHRWDLLRTGRFVDVMKASGRNAEAKHALFPIPLLELQANPALIQNDDY